MNGDSSTGPRVPSALENVRERTIQENDFALVGDAPAVRYARSAAWSIRKSGRRLCWKLFYNNALRKAGGSVSNQHDL